MDILRIIFIGSLSLYELVFQLLFFAGLIFLFGKCGVPRYFAVIPGFREYYFAKCADREAEGRVLLVTDFMQIGMEILLFYFRKNDALGYVLITLDVVIFLTRMIYLVRAYGGICEVFGRKKTWVIPWFIVRGPMALLWGLLPQFQPLYTVREMDEEIATLFSGTHVRTLKEGLTVNLEERTVTSPFKTRYLLRDIHLQITPGDMVLLLGGSGAGRTTFINAVTGNEKAKAVVTLNGKDVYKDYGEVQYDIGFVPQGDLVRVSDTVGGVMNDAARMRLPLDMRKTEKKKRIEDVMELFGLVPLRNTLVRKLSFGQRKRLSIAMEFLSDPFLFILDEPDNGLDGVMARELMEQLRQIADEGRIVVVVTHTPDRLTDLFDKVIVLAKDANRTGRLAYYGTIDGAKTFFNKDTMDGIVKSVSRTEDGGEGRADEFIEKFVEVQHA